MHNFNDETIQRFKNKINTQGKIFKNLGKCWEWTASIDTKGYGQINIAKKIFRAHRISFYLANGYFPKKGMVVDHLCSNRKCVNPSHLEEVTHAENLRRAKRNNLFCKHGHEYTKENTYFSGNNIKQCKTCNKESQARIRIKKRIGKIDGRTILKTHCKHGHELNEKNTWVSKKNPRLRQCRVCDKIRKASVRVSHGAVPSSKV